MPREQAAALQQEGRRLLTLLHGALRALKLYPVENAAVQQALAELHGLAAPLAQREGGIELRVVGDFFFLNDARLRLDTTNFAAFGGFARALSHHRVGTVLVLPGVRREEWAPILSLLVRAPEPPDPFGAFSRHLGRAPVEHVEVRQETELVESERDLEQREALAAAKRTYVQSVKVAKDVLRDVRLGRAVNMRQVKRSVQSIVDQVLADEPSMLTLTTLRDYDEYTFTHSVNVSIISVVLGQRLGMDRAELFELGLCGLLHDIGKMHLDPEVINKAGRLTEEDWAELREHPTWGLLALFDMVGTTDMPYRQMLVAYEHHMKLDQSGYPPNRRPRRIGLFSRIVAVADGFDAATSIRSYQYTPIPPDRVLAGMRDDPRRGYDPLLVRTLITATGVFPIGTLVILDTLEVAVVCGINPDPEKLHLPSVKVISDPMGFPLVRPQVVDLALEDPATGKPLKQILKTTDPQKYGIRVSDYLI